MVTAKNVEFQYTRLKQGGQHFSLSCDEFHAAAGAITCIVGSNGSGKTTLLRLLGGTLKPDRGTIHIGEADVQGLGKMQLRQKIAWVDTLSPSYLVDHLIVADHLALALCSSGQPVPFFHRLLGIKHLRMERRISDGLLSEIEPLFRMRIGELSSGQRQTIAIALAMLGRKSLMLVDEGTAHLDIQNARRLFANLRWLATEHDTAVVAITHDVLFAAEFGDAVYSLNDGRVCYIPFAPEAAIHDRMARIVGILTNDNSPTE